MQDVTNRAEFVGTIGEDVRVSHHHTGITFYKTVLHVQRTSGTIDEVPMIVRDTIIKKSNVCKGSKVSVKGTVRSYGDMDLERRRNHMKMYVQSAEMEIVQSDEMDRNEVFLSGTVHGTPILRITPLGRTITDFSIISHATPRKDFIL